MSDTNKEPATIVFRRLPSGEVRGEIINKNGEVVAYYTFGNLTDAEINNAIEAFKVENPEVDILPMIQVIGN